MSITREPVRGKAGIGSQDSDRMRALISEEVARQIGATFLQGGGIEAGRVALRAARVCAEGDLFLDAEEARSTQADAYLAATSPVSAGEDLEVAILGWAWASEIVRPDLMRRLHGRWGFRVSGGSLRGMEGEGFKDVGEAQRMGWLRVNRFDLETSLAMAKKAGEFGRWLAGRVRGLKFLRSLRISTSESLYFSHDDPDDAAQKIAAGTRGRLHYASAGVVQTARGIIFVEKSDGLQEERRVEGCCAKEGKANQGH